MMTHLEGVIYLTLERNGPWSWGAICETPKKTDQPLSGPVDGKDFKAVVATSWNPYSAHCKAIKWAKARNLRVIG